ARASRPPGSPSGSACPQLLRLPDLAGIRAFVLRAGHLEHGRQALQPVVSEEHAELLAEDSLADVRVAVAVRAERRCAVVHVERAQTLEPDRLVDLVEER